ncbi:E3 ubiquitin-protein ligase TRIM56-like [Hydractinia symbiolongicarpus]|uniref:E3 ubiquitin-protein ligase TRIM56-like n=1 Tax=Hydractinia symbiolongicarpus TaxID=13093 RepID=UPI00254FD8FF|nr:E3 ubiquitin-protein ligase TRIM56-like [Hydractinia symbiolongicarpus]
MALSNAMSALLKCKICLDQFEHPKLLSCGHTYCKNCLDEILIFKEDGSAEIRCSLKCTASMIIAADQTTSCFTKNYSLSDIVDEVERSKTQLSNHQCTLCQQSTQCKKKVTFSCTKCGMKICDQCQIVHSCKAGSFTAITFDKKSEVIKPVCEQHNSLANNVCIKCENMFTCVYCINRQHKNHKGMTIAEFGVEAKN